MTAKTGAQRTQSYKQRRKDAGLIQIKVWVHPDEGSLVRKYAAKQPLTKKIIKWLIGLIAP